MSSAEVLDDGFSAFYREHFGAVVRAVGAVAGDAAEDVAQEAFVVLHRRWGEVSGFDFPYGWVRHVALRIGARRGQRDRTRSILEALPSTATTTSTSDVVDLITALVELPERHAAAIWLHHGEDRPVDEVADRLGCSVSATKVLLHRTRRRMAERVGGFTGRWVSEVVWTPDDIARHLRGIGVAQHIDAVLDGELEGRGGRWELTLDGGEYRLFRDDGLRLDDGRFVVRGGALELKPRLSPGRVTLQSRFDGARLEMTSVENTTAPTRGVPDWVFMSLFVGSGPFGFAGRPVTLG